MSTPSSGPEGPRPAPSGAAEAGVAASADRDARPKPLLVALAALPMLLFVYMPRPAISGSQFLVYPVLAAVLGGLLLVFLGRSERLDPRLARLAFLLCLFDVVLVGSFIWNATELRGSAPAEVLRIVLLGLFLLYGYVVARLGGEGDVRRGLLLFSYLVLSGQLIIAATQIAGLEVFDMVYQAEKSRPFGSLFRATGSFANPNIFAWIVAQAGIIAFVLDRSRLRYAALVLTTILVVAAGSRTLLILFPAMVAFAAILTRPPGRARSWYVILGLALAGLFAFAVWFFASYLQYLAQLQVVFTSGSLTSINSFNARILKWQEVFSQFSRGSWGVWLIGLGARPITAVLDNDFLYVLFRFGAIGLLVHLSLFLYIAVLFIRRRSAPVGVVGLQYLVFSLALGLLFETLAGWNIPLFLFLLLGMTLGLAPDRRPALDRIPGRTS